MTEPGVRLPGAVVLALLPLVVLAGWLALSRFDTPSDGTVTGRSSHAWTTQGALVDDVYGAVPLRPGDRVVAIDGIPLERLAGRPGLLTVQVGQLLHYQVLRPAPTATAGTTSLDVPVRLTRYPLAEGFRAHPAVAPLAVTLYLVATFVIVRRPRQPAARALYGLAVLLPVSCTTFPLGVQVVELAGARVWPSVVGDVANCLLWATLLNFALVFPEPAGSAARRRALVTAAYLLPFALYAARLALVLPRSRGVLPRLEVLVVVSEAVAHVQPFLVTAAMVDSYRRGAHDPLVRRRIRWAFASCAVAAVGYLALGQIPSRLIGRPLVSWDWQALLFAPFPVALGLAVLRYRLFDIQVIVRRSLVFGAVTVSLGGLYLLVVAVTTRLIHVPTAVAPFVASVAVALVFGYLRSQIRRLVSRALFGDRDDPFEVMNRLGQRLQATASADSVLSSLVETLADTLRLSYAAITLTGDDSRPVSYGMPGVSRQSVPIMHVGEVVGQLEIDVGPGREPFGVADQRLLDGLTRQLGVISHSLVLETRLRHSLERVVTAREEERRRLRRDLHDGLGPTLASTGFQLELAGSLLDTDPQRARAILDGLGAAHREAVVGLRRLVDGLRPPVLDRLGLVGALHERAEQFSSGDGPGPDVRVDAGDDVEPLPAAVEVAAFHIAQESLTNVARHASATRCVVRLRRDTDALLLEITDDGRGLPVGYRAGIGLGAIRERAVELGGSATVTPGPDGGTTVRARLPVRSEG